MSSTDPSQNIHCTTEPNDSMSRPSSSIRSRRIAELINNGAELWHSEELISLRESFQQERDAIDVELELVMSQYRDLMQRRSAVSANIKNTERTLAPIRLVPNEILQEIFIMARDNEGTPGNVDAPVFVQNSLETLSHDDEYSTIAPWNISRVCQRWRLISFSLPDLWSFFGVDLDSWPLKGKLTKGVMRLAKLQLQRAANAALHVSLKFAKIRNSPLIPLLKISCQRWKCLQISSQDEVSIEELRHLDLNLSGLESLQLGHYKSFTSSLNRPGHFEPPLSILFRDLPRLREVTGHSNILRRFDLPWARLRKVTLQRVPPEAPRGITFVSHVDRLWQYILSSSGIEELYFQDETTPRFNPGKWPQKVITSRSLKKLVLKVKDDQILQYMKTPALNYLMLELDRTWYKRDITQMAQFIKRSLQVDGPACHLTMMVGSLEIPKEEQQNEVHARVYPSPSRISNPWGLGQQNGSSSGTRKATEIELEGLIVSTLDRCCEVLELEFQHRTTTTIRCSIHGKQV